MLCMSSQQDQQTCCQQPQVQCPTTSRHLSTLACRCRHASILARPCWCTACAAEPPPTCMKRGLWNLWPKWHQDLVPDMGQVPSCGQGATTCAPARLNFASMLMSRAWREAPHDGCVCSEGLGCKLAGLGTGHRKWLCMMQHAMHPGLECSSTAAEQHMPERTWQAAYNSGDQHGTVCCSQQAAAVHCQHGHPLPAAAACYLAAQTGVPVLHISRSMPPMLHTSRQHTSPQPAPPPGPPQSPAPPAAAAWPPHAAARRSARP